MKRKIFFILILVIGLLFSGCVTFAPPSPMVTFGGPVTTPKGTSETALAFGSAGALFEGSHSGGIGWFGRYKYGLCEKFDLGFDAIGFTHSDNSTFTAKVAARYQLRNNLRLEGGVGIADDSDGKSVNSDLGLTLGTPENENPWNTYATLRFGYAIGLPGNAVFSDDESDSIAPPDAGIVILNIGRQGRINGNMKFIFEGGWGYIYPYNHKPGVALYLACGMLFNIGK